MLRRITILLFSILSLVFSARAQELASSGNVPLFGIPAARKELAVEAEHIRTELADLPSFSESRQIDAYGFLGAFLPVLDEMPDAPLWSVTLSWGPRAQVTQVILVPAIDPRQGKVQGYGFPRRFRVSKQFPDGTLETVAEWMDEDCPDPAHVPLQIELSEPRCAVVRIDVYRGAQEGGKEFFALGEVFGIVGHDIWQAKMVMAGPEFESLPYWSKDYLADQKTGLGMPLGSAPPDLEAEARRDFSVTFSSLPQGESWIQFELGGDYKMGWLTLFPAMPPSGSIVPGYGFPGKIELVGVKVISNKPELRPLRFGWDGGNPGDNAVRIALHSFKGRRLRVKVSDFAEHSGHKIFALGEATISWEGKVYPIKATRFKGFPGDAKKQAEFLTDGRVSGRPGLQLLEWFDLIERQNRLKERGDKIMQADSMLELRWLQVRKQGVLALAVLGLLALVAWIIHRRISLQRLRLRIAEERQHTEMEQMKLQFFTHISHELRTPLTVIPAPIERAMKEVGEGKLRTYLGVALRNVHELQQLVEQILDLRRIQEGMMKINPVELELVVQVRSIIDSMRPLADGKGIELVFEPTCEALVVQSDSQALKRVLGNLIGNAIKFTPIGGRVRVVLSEERCSVMLSVEDTGPGIAAEDLPNIFEQHYRGQSESAMQTPGSGLGLGLVREVVGLLDGRVKAESPVADGQGSRFTVEVPLNKKDG